LATEDAIQELRKSQNQLMQQLADLDDHRASVNAEILRIDEALAALTPGHRDDLSTGSPGVKRHGGKYQALWKALRDRDEDRWETNFAEVEEVLGFRLPPSSRKHLPHWYGTGGSAVARAIRDAGWRATMVDLQEETLTFRRLG
jgi:hypothetical protein